MKVGRLEIVRLRTWDAVPEPWLMLTIAKRIDFGIAGGRLAFEIAGWYVWLFLGWWAFEFDWSEGEELMEGENA